MCAWQLQDRNCYLKKKVLQGISPFNITSNGENYAAFANFVKTNLIK